MVYSWDNPTPLDIILKNETVDGNKKRIAGKVSASTFGSKVMVEGPLKKQSDDGGGSTSFILSFKNSYLEQTSKALYNYIDTAGLPFNFRDIYGKVSINGANGSKVNFYGIDIVAPNDALEQVFEYLRKVDKPYYDKIHK